MLADSSRTMRAFVVFAFLVSMAFAANLNERGEVREYLDQGSRADLLRNSYWRSGEVGKGQKSADLRTRMARADAGAEV